MLRLGGHKDGFFAYDPDWLTEGFDGSVLPYWLTASPERDTLRELLLALHDKVLWLRNRTGPPFTCLQNPNATIEHVRKVLETFIRKTVVLTFLRVKFTDGCIGGRYIGEHPEL